ncbi:MAG: MotA/TolQ/ExbB proton channel family protein [Phycisphaerae bacterium]|jgi:biopolymer transport protein ExbB|nr:MotA/TolQ/ExbB proton channel family protein [Phycisphaerae bacterium]
MFTDLTLPLHSLTSHLLHALPQVLAQTTPAAPAAGGAADTASGPGSTLLKFITGGGIIGYIIVALSIAAMALVVIHAVQIRRQTLIPPDKLRTLKGMLAEGQAEAALEYCLLPSNDCYLCRILAPGLTRYLRSSFGAFELKNAIEEAGAEETARLYRSTDSIGVIGSVAPLLGLLGTVQGMIGAFDTVATSAANNAGYYEQLAYNISIALITTFQGLVVAIPAVTLFTFFRNRIDSVASEAGQRLEELTMLLESAPPAQRQAAPRPAAAARA